MWLNVAPAFDAFRSDPQFKDLARIAGLPAQEQGSLGAENCRFKIAPLDGVTAKVSSDLSFPCREPQDSDRLRIGHRADRLCFASRAVPTQTASRAVRNGRLRRSGNGRRCYDPWLRDPASGGGSR